MFGPFYWRFNPYNFFFESPKFLVPFFVWNITAEDSPTPQIINLASVCSFQRLAIVNDRRIFEIIASPENFFKPKHDFWGSWDFYTRVHKNSLMDFSKNTAIKISTAPESLFWFREILWWGCNFEYSPFNDFNSEFNHRVHLSNFN